jgi:pyruvate dehydrogenase E1 component alpha subunit
MTRILLPSGRVAEGARLPSLSPDEQTRLYRLMLLNRRIDERMVRLQRQGRLGFYVGSVGEEAAIIGSAFALHEKDWILPCYRELGAALVRDFPLFDLFCQFVGNSRDQNKGRQMPNHYCSPELRITSISSPVGSQIPHATGLGVAARLSGSEEAVLVYFGEGATSEGDFHVAANFAAVYKAPTIFFCRNNQWAISVPARSQTMSENFAVKADAYGFEGVQVDGNDVFGVYSVTQQAAEKARKGGGPTLIEAVTYRQGGHSTSDDPRAYREDSEVQEWKDKDPILRLRSYLISQGHLSEDGDAQFEGEIKQEIQENLEKAEAIGPPALETVFEDVFDTLPWHLREQSESLTTAEESISVQEKV